MNSARTCSATIADLICDKIRERDEIRLAEDKRKAGLLSAIADAHANIANDRRMLEAGVSVSPFESHSLTIYVKGQAVGRWVAQRGVVLRVPVSGAAYKGATEFQTREELEADIATRVAVGFDLQRGLSEELPAPATLSPTVHTVRPGN